MGTVDSGTNRQGDRRGSTHRGRGRDRDRMVVARHRSGRRRSHRHRASRGVRQRLGNVTIRAADVERTSIHLRFDYQWSKPEAEDGYRMEGDTLVLDGCGWNCDVDYEVVVPRGTAVTGDADAGNIELDGVASADVRADAGNVEVRDVDGSVKVEADAGNVTGDGLRSPVEADADAGNIELELDDPANVTAKADSGTIELTVPDVGYRVDVSVDSGGQDVRVREDPDSAYVLDLHADSGDVSVRAGAR